MPLIRISLRAGKPADHRRAIAENIYESLRETFNVPENDFFATVDELEPRQLGAVHTWPIAAAPIGDSGGSFRGQSGHPTLISPRQLLTRSGHWPRGPKAAELSDDA